MTSITQPRVVYINRDCDSERRSSIEKILDELQLTPERLCAVEGSQVSPEIAQNWCCKPSEMGCAMSHLSVYQQSMTLDPEGWTLVFEDDISTTQTAESMRTHLLELEKLRQTDNFDVVYLGKCHEICTNLQPVGESRIFYWARHPFCLHAYMFRNGIASMLLEEGQGKVADDTIPRLIEEGKIRCAVAHPGLYYQSPHVFGSGLQDDKYNWIGSVDCKEMSDVVVKKTLSRTSVVLTIVIIIVIFLLLGYFLLK